MQNPMIVMASSGSSMLSLCSRSSQRQHYADDYYVTDSRIRCHPVD